MQNYPPRAWGQDSTTLAPLSWHGNHGYWYEGQLARTLHYVRARWYADADPHGWISADPLGFAGGDWNLYRYVGNRPTVEVDPSGMFLRSELLVVDQFEELFTQRRDPERTARFIPPDKVL